MTSVDEILAMTTGPALYSRRPRARGRARRPLRESVFVSPLEATEWRLREYDFNTIDPGIKKPIADTATMEEPDATSLDVRVLWNAQPPANAMNVVLCLEYTGESLATLVQQNVDAGVPAEQIVIVGDLRAMPVKEYSQVAAQGVFLKHIRYADDPLSQRRARVEDELRLVYRGLLGRSISAPRQDRPRTYRYPEPRVSDEQLSELIADLRREND